MGVVGLWCGCGGCDVGVVVLVVVVVVVWWFWWWL